MSAPSPVRPLLPRYEQLMERPRTRLFTVLTLLGFLVTAPAILILLLPVEAGTMPGQPTDDWPIRFEHAVAGMLILAHLTCVFLAWHYWRNEPSPD